MSNSKLTILMNTYYYYLGKMKRSLLCEDKITVSIFILKSKLFNLYSFTKSLYVLTYYISEEEK